MERGEMFKRNILPYANVQPRQVQLAPMGVALADKAFTSERTKRSAVPSVTAIPIFNSPFKRA